MSGRAAALAKKEMDDEERRQRGAAFTEATDYRGGRWGADGEFYAAGGAGRGKVRAAARVGTRLGSPA